MVATHLYRIAQEAVSNGIRHGKATGIEIKLSANADRITLEIRDDGGGIKKSASPKSGMGLRIMQYRIGMVGGDLAVESDRQGTSIICSVPKAVANSNKQK
jgi:signal transduction histidine kinase